MKVKSTHLFLLQNFFPVPTYFCAEIFSVTNLLKIILTFYKCLNFTQ
jgi:hypothetical protein